jgi:glutamine amidotransferase
MSGKVLVVDYGIGNVFSVCNAIRRAGGDVELSGDLTAIREADRVILPGVGAFAHAMDALKAKGIVSALKDFIATGRPFLGICIGMQVLMDRSTEFGENEGLGLIQGKVVRIPGQGAEGRHLRVPHIGWAELEPTAQSWIGTPLVETRAGADAVYFVHSYHCVPSDPSQILATADYGGAQLTAAIRRDNIVGVQFHPERSAVVGQKILRMFLEQ